MIALSNIFTYAKTHLKQITLCQSTQWVWCKVEISWINLTNYFCVRKNFSLIFPNHQIENVFSIDTWVFSISGLVIVYLWYLHFSIRTCWVFICKFWWKSVNILNRHVRMFLFYFNAWANYARMFWFGLHWFGFQNIQARSEAIKIILWYTERLENKSCIKK